MDCPNCAATAHLHSTVGGSGDDIIETWKCHDCNTVWELVYVLEEEEECIIMN